MTDLKAIIHSDPEIHSGDPVFVGTRVPVRTLLDYIEEGIASMSSSRTFPALRGSRRSLFLRRRLEVLGTYDVRLPRIQQILPELKTAIRDVQPGTAVVIGESK